MLGGAYRGSGPKESPSITGAYSLHWRRGYVLSHVRAGESSPHLDVAYTRFSTGPGARSWGLGLRPAPAPPPSPSPRARALGRYRSLSTPPNAAGGRKT